MMNEVLSLKQARTIHPVHPLLRDRWSARSFDGEPLTETELMTLFEAATWAPSAMNEQPWRYYYAHRGSDAFDRLWESLLPGNRPWTRNAAALVAITGKKRYARSGALNESWMHDAGLANANLLTQATSMGIHGHLLGGYDPAPVHELLGTDQTDEEIICLLALGRLGPADHLEEPFRTRENTGRERRALSLTAKRIGP